MKTIYSFEEIETVKLNHLNLSGIYAIIRKDIKENSVVYVGSSKNVYQRWKTHLNQLKRNKHYNIILQRAFNKYSKISLSFKLLEETTRDNLLVKEQYYIDLHNPKYNIQKNALKGGSPNKHWVICTPDQEWVITTDLKQYSEQNNISYSSMMHIAKGRRPGISKGYFCREAYIKEIEKGKPIKTKENISKLPITNYPYIYFSFNKDNLVWFIKHPVNNATFNTL